MGKRYLSLWLVAGMCTLFLSNIGSGISWAESVYSFVRLDYHTDYIDGGERYRDILEDESYAINALVEEEKTDGTLSQGSYESKANVITNYGKHQLYARVKVTDANKETVMAYAWSEFEDDWIVRAPPGVTTGEMTLGVTVHGNYEGEGNTLYFDFDCEDIGCRNIDVNGRPDIDSFTGSQVVTVTIYYNVDQFFTIRSEAEVTSNEGNYEEGVSGESHIDFGNTIVITSLTLPDGHTLETKSGTTYPLDYTPPDTSTNTDTSTSGGGGGGCFISTIIK